MEAQTKPRAAVELDFAVRGAETVAHAAVPTIAFRLAIENRGDAPVRSIVLDTQVQIAARRRSYGKREQEMLGDLFGTPDRWATTLRTLAWQRVTQPVPAFVGSTVVDLEVACTYDFDVAAAKYLAALGDGDVPLEFQFSGTVFYGGPGGALQTAMIGWDREADYRLPVSVWRATMDRYFAGTAWLRLERETFERLYAYRSRHALLSWEAAIDLLLEQQG